MSESSISGSERAWIDWVAEANEALASLADAGARWWGFGPPCQCFQLVVGDPAGENLAIVLFYCRFLAGPTSWQPQAIQIAAIPMIRHDPSSWRFVLEDARAGFRAESGTFHWARNVNVVDTAAWGIWRPDSL